VAPLTGVDLRQLLEEWLASDEPRPGLAGIRVTYAPALGKARRQVLDVQVGVTPISGSRIYAVALDDMLATPFGMNVVARACATGACLQTKVLQREALAAYLTHFREGQPLTGRLVCGTS
jgi:hypothetical protein